MTPLSPQDLILVTGANGHVAQHVVDQLLHLPSGPRVRGTVRSEGKAEAIRAHYNGTAAAARLELVVVDDIVAEGAFDDAVRGPLSSLVFVILMALVNSGLGIRTLDLILLIGVTHLIHVASPIIISQDDIELNVLRPAIDGTTSALNSALKAGTVKKVVVTSSFGAVVDISQGWMAGYIYSEVRQSFYFTRDLFLTD